MTVDVAPRAAAPRVSRARRLLVVFNPAAGRHRRPKYEAILRALRAEGCAVRAVETTAPGHAEQIARDISPDEIDVIVAAGGDGTVNEIVNGLVAKDIPLGILPLGTANVLADELKIPRDPAALARMLAGGRTVTIHAGIANRRRFCMMAGAGFDARVVDGVSLALKKKLGPLAYVVQAAKVAFTDRSAGCNVTIDGAAHAAESVVVCKGRYYGGPFVAVPEATVRDDRLHVILLKSRGWIASLRYGVALMLGTLDTLRDVRIVPGRNVYIASDSPGPVQADGDIVTRLPVAIGVDQRAIQVVVES